MNKTAKYFTSWILVVTLLFFVLKIMKLINWFWVWVLSPIWISISLLLLYCIVAGTIETICVRRLPPRWRK